MIFPAGSVSAWFGRGRGQEARLLDEWRAAPVNYAAGNSLDRFWNTDHYDVSLGKDNPDHLFERACALVMRNRFYPPDVMEAVSDFSLANRTVQEGDRVVQSIRVLSLVGLPILEVLTMSKITPGGRRGRP